MTILNITKDVNGFNTYAPEFTEDKYSVTLTTSTATALTVPTYANKFMAVFSFSSGADVWVSNGGTAAGPAGAAFAATTSEHNPSARTVSGGDVLSFFSTDTSPTVGVVFYAIQQ